MTGRLAGLVLFLSASAAFAQVQTYYVAGDATEFGASVWAPGQAEGQLFDDGGLVDLDTGTTGVQGSGDATAADGIFTREITFAVAASTDRAVEYKVVRREAVPDVATDAWFGGAAGQNIKVKLVAGTAATTPKVKFYFDTRDQSGGGWLPATNAVSDTVNPAVRFSDGAAVTWVVAGDFQADLGAASGFVPDFGTVARDDGRFGDTTAGDQVFTFAFVATKDYTNSIYKMVTQGPWSGSTKFGADGWAFDGAADAANATFSATTGQQVTIEFDARFGHLRSVVGAAPAARTAQPAAKLLITEVRDTPNEAEFIEIYNPGTAEVDLSDTYITDVGGASATDQKYWEVVTARPPNTGSNDFIAKFPDGAKIGPGAYQTIAIGGARCFKFARPNTTAGTQCSTTNATPPPTGFTGYGVDPTYEFPTDLGADAAIPDMVPAYPNAIDVGANLTGAGLTNTGEVLVLFHWDGASDRVTDLDYVAFDTPTLSSNPPPNKSGAVVDGPDFDAAGHTYAAETAYAAANDAPQSSAGGSVRQDFTEPGQPGTGNGIAEDEMGETSSTSWRAIAVFTPNAPTVHRIDLSPNPVAVSVGETKQVTATVYGDINGIQDISGTNAVAYATTPATPTSFGTGNHIDNTIEVTGLAVGNTESLEATLNGITASATVTVGFASVAVVCDPTSIELGTTSTCTASAKLPNGDPVDPQPDFTWTIETGTAATVAADSPSTTATVTPSGDEIGTVVVKAEAAGTFGTFSVEVTGEPLVITYITANPGIQDVVLGKTTARVQGIAFDQNGAQFSPQPAFSYTSSNPGVATVNASTGALTTVAVGSTRVTVSGGGFTAVALVNVVPAPAATGPEEEGGCGGCASFPANPGALLPFALLALAAARRRRS